MGFAFVAVTGTPVEVAVVLTAVVLTALQALISAKLPALAAMVLRPSRGVATVVSLKDMAWLLMLPARADRGVVRRRWRRQPPARGESVGVPRRVEDDGGGQCSGGTPFVLVGGVVEDCRDEKVGVTPSRRGGQTVSK